jgi:hypothetical protein
MYEYIIEWENGMLYLVFKCPKCKKELANPEKLREHRFKYHNLSGLEYKNRLIAA